MITFGLLKHVPVCAHQSPSLLNNWFPPWSSYFDKLSSNLELHTISDYFGCQSIWHHNKSGYQKWFGRSIMWFRSFEPLTAPFVAVSVATLVSLTWAITTHCDVCVVVDSTLAALLRVFGSSRLMRHWWTWPTCVFQQAVPLHSQQSTVFPHTNTFYGEFRAPCSLNICFPKWFCY